MIQQEKNAVSSKSTKTVPMMEVRTERAEQGLGRSVLLIEMSAQQGAIYVAELRTEREAARWHHTSEILIVAMNFSLSMEWIAVHLGEDTENSEGKTILSEALSHTVMLI